MSPLRFWFQSYSMDCYFRQSWVDSRLSFSGQKTLALSIEMLTKIWKPGRQSAILFCSTSLILLRTSLIQSIIRASVHLLYAVLSPNLRNSKNEKFLETLRIEPRSAGWESQMLPLCYANFLPFLRLSSPGFDTEEDFALLTPASLASSPVVFGHKFFEVFGYSR